MSFHALPRSFHERRWAEARRGDGYKVCLSKRIRMLKSIVLNPHTGSVWCWRSWESNSSVSRQLHPCRASMAILWIHSIHIMISCIPTRFLHDFPGVHMTQSTSLTVGTDPESAPRSFAASRCVCHVQPHCSASR